MAIMNKQSVRDEFDRLKSDFTRLATDQHVSPELKTIFNGMMLLIEVILSIFLEKNTKKNKDNSGKPPSQTEKDESALSDEGSKGKGKVEINLIASNTRTIESTSVISVDHCDRCGESLMDIPCQCVERRTKIDIVFEKTVEHMDAEIKHCPSCDAVVKGKFPSDMSGPLQYGNGIKAFVICLMVSQMVALKRTQNMLKTLIGTVLSEATLLSYVMRVHCALAQWEISAKEALLTKPCIHTDETSLRVEKKNYWIHVYSAGDITLKCLHRKRGTEAMNDIDIIPRYGGTIVHDCWASYLSYDHCTHGLCGSHILRELAFVVESNNYRWAANMRRLLKEHCKKVSKRKLKRLSKKQYASFQRSYRNILTRGETEMPPIPEKSNGKRGKIAKSDAHNLLERLRKHENSVMLFARNSHVPFTNNRAERDLRMSKVKQKVSGCFRVEKYAHAYCRVSSYLQTMSNKGINPLIAIQMALTGEIYK
jgi:transposase